MATLGQRLHELNVLSDEQGVMAIGEQVKLFDGELEIYGLELEWKLSYWIIRECDPSTRLSLSSKIPQ